jgi:hypothetical protein
VPQQKLDLLKLPDRGVAQTGARELALLFALTAVVTAQEFEVASIRPAVEDHSANVNGDKGYYLVHNFTLKKLIGMAWGVDGKRV